MVSPFIGNSILLHVKQTRNVFGYRISLTLIASFPICSASIQSVLLKNGDLLIGTLEYFLLEDVRDWLL
jgi:hypothetical protein